MDKMERIAFILAETVYLDEELRYRLKQICESHWNYNGGITERETLAWPDDKLETVYKVMQGIKMTREYVPDIVKVYENTDTSQLFNRVRFGRIAMPERVSSIGRGC